MGFLLLHAGPSRDAFSNLLQIAACLVAAAYCGAAARRSEYVARTFWTLFALAFTAYAISAAVWTYYESWLGAPVPISAVSQFLYLCYDAPIVIALFLRKNGKSSGLSWPRALDFIQLLLIGFLLYYDFLFLRALPGGRHQLELLEQGLSNAMNVALAGAFFARSLWAGSSLIRNLCRRMSAYLFVYAVAAAIGDYALTSAHATSGNWTTLAWTVPFAFAAALAAGYRGDPESEHGHKQESSRNTGFASANVGLAVLPLTVWILAMRAGQQQRAVAYGTMFVSLACYGSRLALTQWALYRTNELERSQAMALEKSFSLLRSTLESTADGILVVDRAGRVVDFNLRFQQLWKIPGELLETRDDERLLRFVLSGVADEEKFIERVQYLYQHPEEDSFDVVTFKDGRIVERYSRPQMLGSEIAGRVWSFRDVTERERAQNEVATWKGRYDAAVQASGLIIYDWNPASNEVKFGGALKQILGYEASAFDSPTQGWRRLIHPEDQALYQRVMDDALRSKELFDVEYRVRRKDGQYRRLLEQGRVVTSANPDMTHVVGFIRDVTEQRMLEQQLRQGQKMEAVGRLAGGVAHDFNNLLTVIAGYSEMQLQAIPRTDRAYEQAEQIRAATQRAAALTRQLLAFSRQQVLQPKVVNLNQIVAEIEKMMMRIIGQDIEITTRLAADLGSAEVDPGQIEQVLVNLVVNARDAMPRGGKLTIETTNVDIGEDYSTEHPDVKSGRYLRLAVTDTGIGMDQQTRARLFEPFFTTKELGRGTGLGLATVYGIVKQSGGHIEVSSEPGKGATFRIYLPLVDRPADTIAQAAHRSNGVGSETILLVENENAVREMIAKVLGSRGYQVLTASNAEEAENISSGAQEIDLLLTDVMMPKVTGLELGKRITRQRRGIKILYMSGYTANSMLAGEMRVAGSGGFLEKPFTPQALAERVREVLDAKPN